MNNQKALDPKNSVVVEACAGSGKTWLLVSRIIRLLLDGVQPGEILAITFTRKAALEMQARLRDWMYDLATKDDDFVREFLRERAIPEPDLASMLPKARGLYQMCLLAQPALTINTFHGWFMQIIQRAPLDSGLAGGVQLVEKTGALWDEAQTLFFAEMLGTTQSPLDVSMRILFAELGLFNTQNLLKIFVDKRSEWWAYTVGQVSPLDFALDNLRQQLQVDINADICGELFAKQSFVDDVKGLASQLNGSDSQRERADRLRQVLTSAHLARKKFDLLWEALFTQKNTRRSIKAVKGQDSVRLQIALELVNDQLWQAYQDLISQQIYHFNQHALRCGIALLDRYQQLKKQTHSIDFSDLEWRVCQLLNDSPHAEYLQYKLDSRYQHVLLDEFQDTNPLQWQILQAWFDAAAAVQSEPKIFVVGDPKQSIYRFRRADARLFDVVSQFLQVSYQAEYLSQNKTYRNAPAILQVVNKIFDGNPEFSGFDTHTAHQVSLPGWVDVLPLAQAKDLPNINLDQSVMKLRNPLVDAYPENEHGVRQIEAAVFAETLLTVIGQWMIHTAAGVRAVEWGDIMVLVRRRTHLAIYEQALRDRHIPYLTSRRGGLLNTLEALDIQALLTFIMTPFADLQLAHVLRSPLFSCPNEDLMLIANSGLSQSGATASGIVHSRSLNSLVDSLTTFNELDIESPNGINRRSWWVYLNAMVSDGKATDTLRYAHTLLHDWINLSGKLPVHDLLDRIYFDANIQQRYAAAVPPAMRTAVLANLQAFIEISLNIDAGRYPSLQRFLRELVQLKQSDDTESPNEGELDHVGNALRIYTVHEAKGLEAPLVWLLDCNTNPPGDKGANVIVDWPTNAKGPHHFSLYQAKASHGVGREHYFAADQKLADRENLNLLYVAMTRAKQVLLVSGCGELIDDSWYSRIQNAYARNLNNPLLSTQSGVPTPIIPIPPTIFDPRLNQSLQTGSVKNIVTQAQRNGVRLHALLQCVAPSTSVGIVMTSGSVSEVKRKFQLRFEMSIDDMALLWTGVQDLMALPHLVRYFDPGQYTCAHNELPYVNSAGELKRIDRLVEFDTEVWVLDYKLTDSGHANTHDAQLREYQAAMQSVYSGKVVRCALIFADGGFTEVYPV